MVLRKVNAVSGIIASLFLLSHAIFLAVWMLSMGAVPKSAGIMPWILTVIAAIHAIISIVLVASLHKGKEKVKYSHYPKMNTSTLIQRVSGVLLLIFTTLHITGAAGYMQPPQFIHATVPPLFFLLTLVHVAVSVSKSFVTLGVGSAKFIKSADIAIKALCVVILIADIAGFYLFVC